MNTGRSDTRSNTHNSDDDVLIEIQVLVVRRDAAVNVNGTIKAYL